ncbi:hypothetical protein TI05_00870 [Achromatium sp. WMS3]|nr:hypothetical protein TI05_00870 [Achromatium sp. WMS3]
MKFQKNTLVHHFSILFLALLVLIYYNLRLIACNNFLQFIIILNIGILMMLQRITRMLLFILPLLLGSTYVNAAHFGVTGHIGQFRYHSATRPNEWAGHSWFYLVGADLASFKKHCHHNGNLAPIAIYNKDNFAWTMVLNAKNQQSRVRVYIETSRKIGGFCTVDYIDLL